MRGDKLIEVCDKCHTASCYYGELMCGCAESAGTTIMTVGDLSKLNLEHSSNWAEDKLLRIYGIAGPELQNAWQKQKDAMIQGSV